MSLNVINLSQQPLTNAEKEILGKGLSFCPSEDIDKFEAIKDIQLFARKLFLQQLYDKSIKDGTQLKPQEAKAIDTLVSLLDENDLDLDLVDRIDIEDILLRLNKPALDLKTLSKKIRKNQISFQRLHLTPVFRPLFI